MHTGHVRSALQVTAAAACVTALCLGTARADPETFVKACPPIHVANASVTVDVVAGSKSCRVAAKVIGLYANGKHTSRSLSVDGVRWSCMAFGPKAAVYAPWRYRCNTRGYSSAVAGGRLQPAKAYDKIGR